MRVSMVKDMHISVGITVRFHRYTPTHEVPASPCPGWRYRDAQLPLSPAKAAAEAH